MWTVLLCACTLHSVCVALEWIRTRVRGAALTPDGGTLVLNLTPLEQVLSLTHLEGYLECRCPPLSKTISLIIRCILGDMRLWVGDPSTSSGRVSLENHSHLLADLLPSSSPSSLELSDTQADGP